MLHRSNKRKDKLNKPIDNTQPEKEVVSVKPLNEESMSKEDLLMHNEDAKKVYEDIMKLRESVESLKQANLKSVPEEVTKVSKSVPLNDTEAVIAAKRAVFEQAQKDALEQKAKQEELLRREREAKIQQQKVLEAQRRAALIEEEAEKKRQEAEQAEKAAKELARKNALESMEAARRAREEKELLLKKKEEAESVKEKEAFFKEEKEEKIIEADLEEARRELLSAQKQQEVKLDKISSAAEKHTNTLSRIQQIKFAQHKELIKNEQEEVETILIDQKEQRFERLVQDEKEKELRRIKALKEKEKREELARALKAKKLAKAQEEKAARLLKAQAEKEARIKKAQEEKAARLLKAQEEKKAKILRAQAEKEARIASLMAEREAKEARAQAEKEAKKIREEKKRLEKLKRAEEKDLIKRAKKDPEAKAQLEKMLLEEKSKADAKLGGGIVNVQGMTINTEIKEVSHVRWRDLFSMRSRTERKAETAKEQKKLEKERLRRTEEARKTVDMTVKRSLLAYENTAFAKKFNRFKTYCEKHKAALLSAFAVVLLVLVGVAGVFNYYTAYAYSYNGRTLGVVKEKDDVLRITDLVQGALTEEKNIDVIIDARKDISFERVWTTGDVTIDTSEDVLKRLTYMGDLNVKAYGIFVDNKRVGVVEDKSVAEEVFRDLEGKYTSNMEGAEIKSIEIIEKWEGKKCNANLEDVLTKDEMVNTLSSSVKSESLHEVAVDETLTDIAKLYSITEEDILKKNPNIDKRKLIVGSKLVIEKEAPILTVKIKEKVTYDKVIKHKVEKKDSKEIYEGYTETKQEGKDGKSQITSTITLVNGEQIEEEIHKEDITSKPVTEIILVGTKERPPSVGSGKYIWPFESGYTLTSGFKWRWGRLHQGIDLGTPVGNDVLAADGGIVTFAGYSGGYGYLIKVDHQNGMETRYAHNSQLLVKAGDKVFQGMHIAESGNSGRSTGPHLHFEIRVNGTPKDPLGFLP